MRGIVMKHLGFYLVLAGVLLLPACTAVNMNPRTPHPFDEQLQGQWYYECRSYEVDESLPISIEGYAIYLDGRSRERMDVSVGTDCREAGRILTMRWEGIYALGGKARVKLGDRFVEAVRDDELKQKVTYELTPTFVSAIGDDPACKALVGKGLMEGTEPALAQCPLTKEFRELEDRTRNQRTVLYVESCRLLNGDEDAEKDGDRYPATLDTSSWGIRYCPSEQ